MDHTLFTGELVRLGAPDPETQAETLERWHRDTEFIRLGYGRIAEPWSVARLRGRLERHGAEPNEPQFAIYKLDDDRFIGQLGMWIERPHGDAFVWILIGERELWGKGYGRDAMRVLIRYAFDELNLHRLTLHVLAFNRRAIRSYEKLGFVHEGRGRQALNRMGRRWDDIAMGLLKSEWRSAKDGRR